MRHVIAGISRLLNKFGGRARPDAPRVRARIRSLGKHRATLGENPRLLPGDDWLHWLDVRAGEIRGTRLSSGDERRWKVGDEADALALEPDGRLTVLVGRELLRFSVESGSLDRWCTLDWLDVAACRGNDMAWSPTGELLLATMDRQGRRPLGRLAAIGADGSARTLVDGLVIGNGPAVDSSRMRALVADSALGVVHAVPLDGDARASTFTRVESGLGVPDGMAIASDGALWLAHYDGGCLTLWNPDGSLRGWIGMPVARPTAVAIVRESPALRLAVTSARADGDDGGGIWIVDVAP